MIIRNGNLHTGDGEIFEQTDLRIANGKIVEIGRYLDAGNEEEIDASGMEVFPGFIDPLSGIGATGMPTRYMDNREATDPMHPEMNIKYSVDPDELSAQEFYKTGITTVGLSPDNSNIMGGQVAVFKTPHMPFYKRMVKEKVMVKGSVTSSVKTTYGDKNIVPMTKMGIFFLLEKMFSSVEHKSADNYDEKEKVMKQILNRELPVCIAAEKQSEIQAAIQFFAEKQIPVTLSDCYEFHKCLKEIKEHRVNIIIGNVASLSRMTKHDMDMSKLNELLLNGNLIAFTTTSGGASEGREVFLWNAISAYRAGVLPENVVKMLTSHPAKILGLDDRIGRLRVGMDADISIFTGHPVTSYQAKVIMSIVDGEVVYHG